MDELLIGIRKGYTRKELRTEADTYIRNNQMGDTCIHKTNRYPLECELQNGDMGMCHWQQFRHLFHTTQDTLQRDEEVFLENFTESYHRRKSKKRKEEKSLRCPLKNKRKINHSTSRLTYDGPIHTVSMSDPGPCTCQYCLL